SLAAQGISLNGYVRNYTGVLMGGDNEFSILQNTFNLNLEHSKDNVSFKVNPLIYSYENGDPSFDIREAYIDIFFDAVDLRIGKQQIIWGKADGVFITDIISPKNLSEFLLPDFDEIRIGTTSLKANYYLGNSTFELVWTPAFTPTELPGEDSHWYRAPEFKSPNENIPSPTLAYDYTQKAIPASLENSETFLKFSGVSSFIDYEIMGGTIYDDDPTMHIDFNPNPNAMGLPEPILTLTPQHHRLSVFGGSTGMDVKGYVIRTEAAYYAGKFFQANEIHTLNTPQGQMNMTLPSALVEKDYLHYLIGTDFAIGETKLSAQFIQKYILDYDDTIIQSEFSNMATFLAVRSFMNETLTMQLFTYYDITNEDALIRPTVSYDLSDGFEILGGANIFMAGINNDYTSSFGYYDDNDMLYVKLKYSF
ncbi:MAG: hypothetical protein KAI29_20830, partial [Cyclobacteriaceae bacterium]|nr:hypothetical protein [Cyclobacteriaceae bacterium]